MDITIHAADIRAECPGAAIDSRHYPGECPCGAEYRVSGGSRKPDPSFNMQHWLDWLTVQARK